MMLIAINVMAIITIVDNRLYISLYIFVQGRKITITQGNKIKYVAGAS